MRRHQGETDVGSYSPVPLHRRAEYALRIAALPEPTFDFVLARQTRTIRIVDPHCVDPARRIAVDRYSSIASRAKVASQCSPM